MASETNIHVLPSVILFVAIVYFIYTLVEVLILIIIAVLYF